MLQDFYGEEIKLLVCGYIRPEANFTSLDALKERILEDGRIAKQALAHPRLAELASDAFLSRALQADALL
jgi:riboflavin kinase / FMN hydrolase